MNKEELIGKLQMVYVGDINALNELIGYYDGLKQVIEELQQENKKLNGAIQTYDILLKSNVEENKQLKDNWNKLKMWLNNFHRLSTFEQWEIVNKIQELEQGSDSNVKD